MFQIGSILVQYCTNMAVLLGRLRPRYCCWQPCACTRPDWDHFDARQTERVVQTDHLIWSNSTGQSAATVNWVSHTEQRRQTDRETDGEVQRDQQRI